MPQGLPTRHQRRRVPHPIARAMVGLAAALVILTTGGLGDAEAWSPRASLAAYSPRHVWQLKDNCVWAAGQMLVDKWTGGNVRLYQGRLRRASGDKKGGSSLYDLARGVRRLTGLPLRSSPGLGDPMTWWQLLDRLERGGGAVLIGEYKRLPAHFTRWNRRFARKRRTSHAVFVEKYDRANARVWLMDPLAVGDYPGEWISVKALRRYASFKGRLVVAAATPATHRPTTAPLTDQAYRLEAPRLARTVVAGSTVSVRVGLKIRDGFPSPAPHRFVGHWDPIVAAPAPNSQVKSRAVVDTTRAIGAEVAEPVPAATTSAAGRAGRHGFVQALPVPAIPGRYRLSLALAESGSGDVARTFAPVEVTVIGPFAASWAVAVPKEVTVGRAVPVRVTIGNIGTTDWRAPKAPSDGPRPSVAPAQTQLVMTWLAPGREVKAGVVPAELAPGASATLKLHLVAPDDAGPWTLAFDLVNLELGSLASTGATVPSLPVLVDPVGLSAEP